ncbi:uncharacterized protein F4822DRAFT_419250 [Hypoxylon trugodes]|uniref:uncharacterized protein n=1 Tax=Hypoxylon trugodes TaxID=326681 RepID=UPI00219871F1|nr:uncharacterized protein F4822DRAFT_419250 [Hypoxylon trugodes]KAI1384292.1 hypothetical protein F4822DRAFT_419250 [Hypoxylon trugodes]
MKSKKRRYLFYIVTCPLIATQIRTVITYETNSEGFFSFFIFFPSSSCSYPCSYSYSVSFPSYSYSSFCLFSYSFFLLLFTFKGVTDNIFIL